MLLTGGRSQDRTHWPRTSERHFETKVGNMGPPNRGRGSASPSTTGILNDHVAFKHGVCLRGNPEINDSFPKSIGSPRPRIYTSENAKPSGREGACGPFSRTKRVSPGALGRGGKAAGWMDLKNKRLKLPTPL